MANSERGSRSSAIRSYLRAHPGAGPKEIQATLAKQGVAVTLGRISFVKYHKPKRRAKAPVLRVAARRTAGRGQSVTVDQLLEVKRVVESLGGPAHVRRALATLESLL